VRKHTEQMEPGDCFFSPVSGQYLWLVLNYTDCLCITARGNTAAWCLGDRLPYRGGEGNELDVISVPEAIFTGLWDLGGPRV
jgi:hypothetical protein